MQQKRLLRLTVGFIGTLALISLYSCNKNNTLPNPRPLDINEDIDGNHYDTVRIGKQLWMVQSLRVTRYNDGTPINNITNIDEWKDTARLAKNRSGARCYFNNDSATHAATYGELYNWYAVNHKGADGKANLAPKGWHVPDTTDWNTLIGTLNGNPNFTGGNDPNVGGKLKETGTKEAGTGHWHGPNTGATNNSGFKALPAGYRNNDGNFTNLGNYGYFWSSTGDGSNNAYYQVLGYGNAGSTEPTLVSC